jgi:hypothetical protein
MDTPSTFDPLKPTVLNLSPEEYDEIDEQIAAGVLPVDWYQKHYEAIDRNVFGHDFKRDAKGRPIETGIGSNFNLTANAVEAYIKEQTERRQGGPEPGFEENLAKLRKQLAVCEARRREEAKAKRFKYGRRA